MHVSKLYHEYLNNIYRKLHIACNSFNSKSIVYKASVSFGFIYLLLAITVINQFFSDPSLNWSFCFSNKCLEVVSRNFEYKLIIFKELTIFFALCLTAIGVRTGLQTYKLSLENSILSNHNDNLKVFIDFCNCEVVKYELLDASKINYYELYNVFYPNSREGKFYNFEILEDNLCLLKKEIIISNVEYQEREVNRAFKFRKHQGRIIKLAAKFGFNIDFRNRVDFYKIESQIYNFIDSLILNFSTEIEGISTVERKYSK